MIRGYRAIVEPSAVGLGVTAMVGIEPGEYGEDDVIAAALSAMPEVESCYGVAGDQAFIFNVGVPTVDDLHLRVGALGAIDGVARTRTTVVLSTRFEGRPNRLSPEEP